MTRKEFAPNTWNMTGLFFVLARSLAVIFLGIYLIQQLPADRLFSFLFSVLWILEALSMIVSSGWMKGYYSFQSYERYSLFNWNMITIRQFLFIAFTVVMFFIFYTREYTRMEDLAVIRVLWYFLLAFQALKLIVTVVHGFLSRRLTRDLNRLNPELDEISKSISPYDDEYRTKTSDFLIGDYLTKYKKENKPSLLKEFLTVMDQHLQDNDLKAVVRKEIAALETGGTNSIQPVLDKV